MSTPLQPSNKLTPPAEADARLLRWAIAFVWLATGILVVVPEYRAIGSSYLGRLGVPDWLMVATCVAEIALGLRVTLGRMATWLVILQMGMILAFSAILAKLEPGLLASPHGVLTKNIPLLAMIGTAWLLEREGWTARARWVLRAGLGAVWITEGLLPKVLFQQPSELLMVAESGVVPGDPGDFLFWLGVAEVTAGLTMFVLPRRPLRILLACQLIALPALLVVASLKHGELWFHPFGPLTKTVAILVGTFVLLRRT